jgi:hypothetical protein
MDAISQQTNVGIADGEVVWSWRPDAGVKSAKMLPHLADDGGKRARSQGRARISRKTIAQGRPDDRLNLWFCRVLLSARGPWVPAGARPSLRPLIR